MFNKFYKRIDRGVLALYNVLNKMLEELNMTLVEIIIKYRTEHNLSQRAFAERCGVSNGYISMLEKNRNPSTEAPITPTLPTLRQIAKGLNMSLDELLALADDMEIGGMDKKSAPSNGDGQKDDIDIEIAEIISRLPAEKKLDALKYLRYLEVQ